MNEIGIKSINHLNSNGGRKSQNERKFVQFNETRDRTSSKNQLFSNQKIKTWLTQIDVDTAEGSHTISLNARQGVKSATMQKISEQKIRMLGTENNSENGSTYTVNSHEYDEFLHYQKGQWLGAINTQQANASTLEKPNSTTQLWT